MDSNGAAIQRSRLFAEQDTIWILTFMEEKDGKYIFGVVKVGDKGQIVIPRDARKQYDIKPGDALLLLGDDSGMALVKTEIFESLVGQVMEGLTK